MYIIIILLLPLSVGVAKLSNYAKDRKRILLDHQREVEELQTKIYIAFRMKYLRTPIVVQTQKQESYYNKLKVHYKNSTRKVELIAYNLGEDKTSYRKRVHDFVEQWCSYRLEEIEHGNMQYRKYFKEVRESDKLAYLKSPFKNEESKEFIYQQIQFLLDNPKPVHGNYKTELILRE